jgi:DNA-binding NtrC family response regulator
MNRRRLVGTAKSGAVAPERRTRSWGASSHFPELAVLSSDGKDRSAAHAQTPPILVVEEDTMLTVFFALVVDLAGGRMDRTDSIGDACRLLKDQTFQAIIFDGNGNWRPGLDLSGIARFRMVRPDVPIILATTHEDVRDIDVAAHSLFAAVSLPGGGGQLLDVVARALARRDHASDPTGLTRIA